MPYDPTVPTTGSNGASDYVAMQQNFAQIQNSFSVNHEPLAVGGTVEGYHTQIQLATALGADPGKPNNVSSIYSKLNPAQLFFQNSASVFQLTGSLVNDGSNGTIASEYTVVTPFGITFKFGITQAVASGTALTLVSAFPTNFLGVVVTPRLATFAQMGANITGSPSQFTVYQSTGGNQVFYFFAWGD